MPSALLWTAVAFGGLLRARQFAGRRSLWLDEAELGLNVAARGLLALLHPLAFNQAAAPGWLWVERVSVRLFGVNEYALRLPQLLAGCALLVLTGLLARRLLGPALAWVAVLLVALSPQLLDYSNEAKPYAVDAAVTGLLLLLLVRMLEPPPPPSPPSPPSPSRRALAVWALASTLAVVTSWAAIVTVTAGALVLLGLAVRTARRAGASAAPALRRVALAQVAWLVVLGLQYAVVLRRVADNAALRRYWSRGYPSGPLDVAPWTISALRRVLGDPLHLSIAPLAAALVVLGAVLLLGVCGRPAVPVVLLVPAAVLIGVAHAYPLQQRAALFLVAPTLLLLVAPLLLVRPALASHRPVGRPVSRRDAGRRTVLASGVVAAVLLVTVRGAVDAAATLPHVVTHAESRQVLSRLGGLARPGDGVFVDAYSEPAYAFYSGADGLPRASLIDVTPRRLPCSDAATLRRRAPSGRVWLVLTDVPARGSAARRDATYTARFERLGRVTALLRAPRSVLAVGVDLDEPTAARPAVADPQACLVVVRAAAAPRRP